MRDRINFTSCWLITWAPISLIYNFLGPLSKHNLCFLALKSVINSYFICSQSLTSHIDFARADAMPRKHIYPYCAVGFNLERVIEKLYEAYSGKVNVSDTEMGGNSGILVRVIINLWSVVHVSIQIKIQRYYLYIIYWYSGSWAIL